VLTVLAGCWGQVGFDASLSRNNTLESRLTAANVGTLAPVWSQQGTFFSEPMVPGDGRLYAVNGGTLEALSSADGHTLWTRTLVTSGGLTGDADNRPWPVVKAGDELWVGWERIVRDEPPPWLCDGAIQRVDPGTGTVLGTVDDGGPGQIAPVGSLAITNAWHNEVGNDFSCGGSSFLTVSDLGSGTPIWAADQPNAGAPNMPVVIGDRLFDGVRAYDLTGCGAAICPPVGFITLPLDVDLLFHMAGSSGRLFATARVQNGTQQSSDLLAIDPQTLEVLWRAPLTDLRDGVLAITPDSVFVVGIDPDGSTIEAFPAAGCGAATCDAQWRAPLGYNGSMPAIAVAGGVVYAGHGGPGGVSAGSEVLAFDAAGCGAATCSPLASLDVLGAPNDIVVASGRLFVVSGNRSQLQVFAPA
jgi:hypothetical protein